MAASPAVSYEQWEATFNRLMGIEGKVLDEEVPGRSARNIEFFTRFKARHPDQLVLLHYNGNARDPRYEAGRYFAGHWVYYNGATVLCDVPAEDGETEIRVADARLFRTGIGRYRDKNDDVGLSALDAGGRPDWHESEQVQLVSADVKGGLVRVKRGCYGTRPRAFAAGKAYAAAHVTEGPWGRRSNLMWFYNYSTRCPRDAGGRSCAEVHAEELAERFSPGGRLAAFDGLEFDVLAHERRSRGARGLDCDADGRADDGLLDGVNTYGVGVVEFCRDLRKRLGDDRLILADGMGLANQRAFRLLNGIESEGWPHLGDWEIRDWSGGLNRHFFWAAQGRRPVFNYVNHKFTTAGDKPGERVRPDIGWNVHRLVFAAAVFTDAAVCYSFAPPGEQGERYGVWDELKMGAENRAGWLGMPKRPAVRLAEATADLLGGRADPVGGGGLGRFQGAGAGFALDGQAAKVTSAKAEQRGLVFRLAGVPSGGPDLAVFVTARAAPMTGYPPEVARLMWVGVAPAGERRDRSGERAAAPLRYMTWLGPEAFRSGFYFSQVGPEPVDIEFTVEGGEPVWISAVTVHAAPDAVVREFERGVVLANPSPRPYEFDLAGLFPGRAFRRLQGSPRQDPETNDGSAVRANPTLGPKDALFLADRAAF
ncbi:MAG: hypothetical protein AMS14_08635 [Planctomycetes bacterium DG_20]|nr:MAG: hypothetical protein AMS14_08635 [Planctomycetes bacterium DG_20]